MIKEVTYLVHLKAHDKHYIHSHKNIFTSSFKKMLDNKSRRKRKSRERFTFDAYLIWHQCSDFHLKQDDPNDKYWCLKMLKDVVPAVRHNTSVEKPVCK